MKKIIKIPQNDRWSTFFKKLKEGLVYNSFSENGYIVQYYDGKEEIIFPNKGKKIAVQPVYHDGWNSNIPWHGKRYSYYVRFFRTNKKEAESRSNQI